MQYIRYLLTILPFLLPFQNSTLTLPYQIDGVKVEIDVSTFDKNVDKYTGKLKKVVLDAGHGGKDHGCTVKPNREKDIALKIVLELGNMIKRNHPDVEVIYTRKTDVFVPLRKRIKIANENDADLFISVHCNYSEYSKVKGSESYVMGLHTATENLNVAKRENASILYEVDFEQHYDGYNPNSPAGHIILSMYQHAFLEQSINMAQKVEYAFNSNKEVKSRGVKQAGFVVLRKATMPSVLIEAGYLSNSTDSKRLASSQGQKEVAQNIYQAFIKYKEEMEVKKDHIVSTPVKSKAQSKKDPTTEFRELKKKDLKNQNFLPTVKMKKQYRKGDIETSPKPAKSSAGALTYRVQIAASNGKQLNKSGMKWQQLTDLDMRYEDGMYKYLVGSHLTLEDALVTQQKMRNLGFNGAFIVAYDGQTRIGLKKAKEITSKKNNF